MFIKSALETAPHSVTFQSLIVRPVSRYIYEPVENEIMEDKLRRQSKRHSLDAPHAPLLRWKGKAEEHDGCISEISLNGCFLNTRGVAAVGEIISFSTKLTTGENVELRGEAIHHDKKLVGFGVRFLYRSAEERMFVASLIEAAGNRT